MNRKVLRAEFHAPIFAGGINIGAVINTQEISSRWTEITARADSHGIYVRVKTPTSKSLSREHFVPMAMIKVAELDDETPNGGPIKPKAANLKPHEIDTA